MELNPFSDMEPNTPDQCRAMERALCGAIGWLSAGANEGNNAVYQETHKRLAVAAGYFARKAEALSLSDNDQQEKDNV